jgi:rifampicin phosphotransferase
MSAPQQATAPPARAQRPLVVTLDDLDETGGAALDLLGGKAANLGELIRAQLPVPPGFCLTTEAYERAAPGVQLTGVFAELTRTEPGETVAIARLAGTAREAILAAPMPGEVAQAVERAYLALGDGQPVPVAVRSSATAEDLPFASFAGQQDTYLNVVGTAAVLEAVHRCWSSLWTDRAVAYRTTNGIDHRTVRLAVVVQRMVDSAVAGVMFTANPVTGRRLETVIDASPGLGEAVVSGAVNPDHFVVDTGTGQILTRRLGDKRVAIRSRAGGGTVTEAPPATGTACLTDQQVRDLAALGGRVQAHYGSPQDTEWAIDAAGALWLTQARPITTLFPLPEGREAEDDLRVYFCASVAQGMYRPLTPMGFATVRAIGAAGASRLFGFPPVAPEAGPSAFRVSAGWWFFDVTPIVRSTVGRAVAPKVLDVMEARSAAVLRRLFDDPRLSVVYRSRWPVVRRAGRMALRYGVPVTAARALLRPELAVRRTERIGAEIERRAATPEGATAARRLEFAVALVGDTIPPLLPRVFPSAAAGFAMLGLAAKLLGTDARPGDLQTVLRGLPHNVTTEMDLDLWRLAAGLRDDPAVTDLMRRVPAGELAAAYRAGTLPPTLRQGLADFLDRYGHRAGSELDVGMPRWREDPTHILGVLANYLRLEDPDLAPDTVFARGAAAAEAMVGTLTGRARRRGRLRGEAVAFALRRARLLGGLRELPKYYLVKVLAAARTQLLAAGAEMAAAGRLDKAEDVFFLDLREAREAARGTDLRDVVQRRRESYERELRRRHVPRVLLSDGTEPEAGTLDAAAAGNVLRGTAASAGTVTGPARVVLDPVGAHLEPGEILVAPSTDPGWTPLFLTAGGLVMEMGGANSHGAVVAREYGIPAVVGVPEATNRISTGRQVTVNGSAGVVETAEDAVVQ